MDTLAKIRARQIEIDRQIAALSDEASDLEVAARVVARLETPPTSQATEPKSQLTHPDLIVATLKAAKGPWFGDWSGLQRAIKEMHGVDIPKSSLQPYLSNLKNQGVIVRNGPNIALRVRVEKGAGPESDNSYDPATAVAADDDDSPKVRERIRSAPTTTTDFRLKLGVERL